MFDEYIGSKDAVKELVEEIIESISTVIDVHDKIIFGHSKRVSLYAEAIGKELKMNEKELFDLKIGALFHDFGKLFIPDEILRKPIPLTLEEYEIMKTHSELGSLAFKKIKLLKNASTYIKEHHERFDGNGYPDKLKGNKISLGGRIIAVCDAFDTMTRDHGLRKIRSLDDAKKELLINKETQFDPEVVDTFIKILERDSFFNNINEKIKEDV